MCLLCITDAVKRFGITSKTLRYYERVGLLAAKRAESNNYRYYDASEVERIKQIIVLRKMQIPIKDIIRIYENEDMRAVVAVFVARIAALDDEVGALTELRRITNEFLQTMLNNGIKKISALPLLYEEMDKKLEVLEERSHTFSDLAAVSEKLSKPVDAAIITLPPMRILSSRLKENPRRSDPEGFWLWVQAHNVPLAEPGSHGQFECQTDENDVVLLRIHDFVNAGPYADGWFEGGLFAAVNMYLDDDMQERFRSAIAYFNNNQFYEIDYRHNGALRHEVLIETLISPDDKRELVSMMIPVKKRYANPAHFEEGVYIENITPAELETQNPILWTKEADIMQLTPRENSTLTLLENGEVSFVQWLWPGALPTGIAVKIPFRVDVAFRAKLNSLNITHGKGMMKVNGGFQNDHAQHRHSLTLRQPVFGDERTIDHIGAVNPQDINMASWIVGEKYIACILNGKVKLCCSDTPYMRLDPQSHIPHEIIIGSDQDHYHHDLILSGIKISQLATIKKNKLAKGAFTMITKQSNNILPDLHPLITWHYGENYVVNGCMRLLMERVKPAEPITTDNDFYGALTGDTTVQVYGRGLKRSYNIHDIPLSSVWDGQEFMAYLFNEIGYGHSYVTAAQINENKGMYTDTVKAYIDKGIPVLARTVVPAGYGSNYELIVGYEEGGKVLLYLDGDDANPRKEIVGQPKGEEWPIEWDWIFIGDKKRDIDKKTLYTNALKRIAGMLTAPDKYSCSYGAKAFRDWADDIENGYFANGGEYTTYVCLLATNAGRGFAYIHNKMPKFTFLKDILDGPCKRIQDLWGKLESLNGGFNVTNEVMQDTARRKQIADKVREFAVQTDEITGILSTNA